MTRIYADNSATSFPKAPGVAETVADFITCRGVNISRSSYELAYNAETTVYNTRRRLSRLFGCEDAAQVIFTPNVTTGINMVLKGLLRPHDHLLISGMEHNAVLRPAVQLGKQGTLYDVIPCDGRTGLLDVNTVERYIRPQTRAVVICHGSNVNGIIQPVAPIGKLCHDRDIYCIVDCAQTAGSVPIDVKEMHIDALCFTGHKGLMGPQGIGGLVLNPSLADELIPLIAGGTGSFSHLETMPVILPDKFEAGTMNLPGIAGLHEALLFLEKTGIDTIRDHEMTLAGHFIDGLSSIPHISAVGRTDKTFSDTAGPKMPDRRGRDSLLHDNPAAINYTAVVSVTTDAMDVADLAFRLDKDFHIMTRVGLHCAPLAHRTLGTYPTGTVRFSFGFFNTVDDVNAILNALQNILNN